MTALPSSENPLHPPLDTLFRRLVELNGFLNYVENGLGQFTTHVKSKVGRGIFLARALMLQDLSESEWSVPIGVHSLKGDRTYQFFEEVKSVNYAWALAQAYDAFEGYLREVMTTCFHHYPLDMDTKDVNRFNAKAEKPLDVTQKDSIASFVRFSYRKNIRLLSALRKLAPELGEWERHNRRGINFHEWHKAGKSVRDSIIHEQGEVPTLDWSESKCENLTKWFSGVHEGDRIVLKMTTVKMINQLELTACYAFLIFKALS